jgi:acetyl-CoA acetyltransferase
MTANGANGRPSFLGRTAIAGVGYTELSKDSGLPVSALAIEACRAAVEDAGLTPEDVDGIVSFSLFNDSINVQAVQTGLAIPDLTYAVDLSVGGEAPCMCVILAAMAVETGMAKNVLIYRALNGRSGVRIGSTQFRSPSSPYRYPIGFSAYPQFIALWARRYMIETGATEEDLAGVVLAQRAFAADNERAIQRRQLTLEEYMASPMIVDPFHSADCTNEVDGACAVLVTSLDRARDLPHPPAVIQGAAWMTGPRSGLDIGDLFQWEDFSRNVHSYMGPRLLKSARMTPADVDFAEIYDCFSIVPLLGLEGLGLVGRGEAGAFVREGNTALDGSLPMNTHGGLLCEGYLHGMNTVNEAVLQIQGRGGSRQVRNHDVCAVTSGALMDGSQLILTSDR